MRKRIQKILTVLRQARRERMRRQGKGEAGFSLLEIMIVIALIALFAILVGPAVIDMFTEGQEEAARVQIKQFEQGLKLYYRNCGRYPNTTEGLNALISPTADCKKWKPTIDTDVVPEDPWGNEYLYYSPGVRSNNEYEVISRGQNIDDESDDITSYTRAEG